ncbi:hypothetical protein B5X24_HaOG214760 [Helicoverpa armigera]|uniref:Uncharacterized protein n=1 Tax=Helicoverpa armigera TaxID=29058 RepID=A0A2W1B1X4_HELAM|nr:hypothetical protein B5X24_HaOG214760 [Helicoverpa armigera]
MLAPRCDTSYRVDAKYELRRTAAAPDGRPSAVRRVSGDAGRDGLDAVRRDTRRTARPGDARCGGRGANYRLRGRTTAMLTHSPASPDTRGGRRVSRAAAGNNGLEKPKTREWTTTGDRQRKSEG